MRLLVTLVTGRDHCPPMFAARGPSFRNRPPEPDRWLTKSLRRQLAPQVPPAPGTCSRTLCQSREFALNPDHVIMSAATRTVTLSVAAENIVMAACRELDDLQRQLRQDRQALSTMLVEYPDNPIVLRGIQFLKV